MSDLLADIESFLTTSGMTPTAFGRDGMKDPGFVTDLREGRRVWPETEQRARDFMASHKAEAAE